MSRFFQIRYLSSSDLISKTGSGRACH